METNIPTRKENQCTVEKLSSTEAKCMTEKKKKCKAKQGGINRKNCTYGPPYYKCYPITMVELGLG